MANCFRRKRFSATRPVREEKNSRMNVSNFVFYKSLRSFLPFGPNFCGVQGSTANLLHDAAGIETGGFFVLRCRAMLISRKWVESHQNTRDLWIHNLHASAVGRSIARSEHGSPSK
jgi:hypothetical protein